MNIRKGFTLIELVIAVLIFSYITASMATIYSTAHRHAFQNYRGDLIKTGALLGIRDIQNKLPAATRIDSPAAGARGDILAFAVNIDKSIPDGGIGCYPVNHDLPVSWHYFCLADDPLTPGYQSLYHHTGNLTVTAATKPCGKVSPATWGANPPAPYPVPSCGVNIGGQTVTLLTQYVDTSSDKLFSRAAADGVYDACSVRVRLRSKWPGLTGSQRPIDFKLDTLLRASCSR